jgi:hypothetical protein
MLILQIVIRVILQLGGKSVATSHVRAKAVRNIKTAMALRFNCIKFILFFC